VFELISTSAKKHDNLCLFLCHGFLVQQTFIQASANHVNYKKMVLPFTYTFYGLNSTQDKIQQESLESKGLTSWRNVTFDIFNKCKNCVLQSSKQYPIKKAPQQLINKIQFHTGIYDILRSMEFSKSIQKKHQKF
jgi:hypothetical protein